MIKKFITLCLASLLLSVILINLQTPFIPFLLLHGILGWFWDSIYDKLGLEDKPSSKNE